MPESRTKRPGDSEASTRLVPQSRRLRLARDPPSRQNGSRSERLRRRPPIPAVGIRGRTDRGDRAGSAEAPGRRCRGLSAAPGAVWRSGGHIRRSSGVALVRAMDHRDHPDDRAVRDPSLCAHRFSRPPRGGGGGFDWLAQVPGLRRGCAGVGLGNGVGGGCCCGGCSRRGGCCGR